MGVGILGMNRRQQKQEWLARAKQKVEDGLSLSTLVGTQFHDTLCVRHGK